MKELQKVICLDNEVLVKGKEYYLDITTILGDSNGEWRGFIFRDEYGHEFEGNYYLKHFKSKYVGKNN